MSESQNIEWKESWRDEYLKWICGFANAQGGRIYIGTDDRGTVIGVTDCKKLLEDIPNIANGFFRAGYVETWGRGIEKICEACKNHGILMPEYTLHLEDIMVKLTPLTQFKVPKESDGTLNVTLERNILSVIIENPHVTQAQIAVILECSERKVKRVMKEMIEKGIIERVGGRKIGKWIKK